MPSIAPGDPYDDDESYMPVRECAEKTGLSVEAVERLVRMRVLKARHHGIMLVQPACVPGFTA